MLTDEIYCLKFVELEWLRGRLWKEWRNENRVVRWKCEGGRGTHRFANRLVSASSCFVVAFLFKVRMGCMAKKDFPVSINTFASCVAIAYLLSDAFLFYFIYSFLVNIATWLCNHCLYQSYGFYIKDEIVFS
jgi:hypothetical protein